MHTMTPSEFAAFVTLCKERGMTQKALAETLGINETRVKSYQTRIPPSQAKLLALACDQVRAQFTQPAQ